MTRKRQSGEKINVVRRTLHVARRTSYVGNKIKKKTGFTIKKDLRLLTFDLGFKRILKIENKKMTKKESRGMTD